MKLPQAKHLVVIAALALTQSTLAQDPWPVERRDRYGSANATSGPELEDFTLPWVSNRLAVGFPVSHGASIRADGVGFFGNWAENRLYKFDTATGAILGTFNALNFVACVPALTNNIAVVSTDNPNARIFGIDTQIMDYNWSMVSGYVGGSPNIGPEGDVVFGISAGSIFRLNSLTGGQIWSRSGFGPTNGTIVFTRDDAAVIVSQGTSATALSWTNGSTLWQRDLGSMSGKPAVAPNGTIVVGSASGTIYGLNPASGAILWTWTALDSTLGAPAFSPDGTVAYVPSKDYRVYAIRVSDGARLWSYTTSLWCEHGGVVDKLGRIYIHNKAGDLYCISPGGTLVWSAHLNGEARGPLTMGPDATLYVGYSGSTSGLAVIRQLGVPLSPISMSVEKGQIISGDLNDCLQSDDKYAVFTKSTSSLDRMVRVIFTAVTAQKPVAQINVKVESKSDRPGVIQQLEIWSYSQNRWDQISSKIAGINDSMERVNIVGAGGYANQSGEIKIRVSWMSGPAAQSNWRTFIDYVHFDVAPQFVP